MRLPGSDWTFGIFLRAGMLQDAAAQSLQGGMACRTAGGCVRNSLSQRPCPRTALRLVVLTWVWVFHIAGLCFMYVVCWFCISEILTEKKVKRVIIWALHPFRVSMMTLHAFSFSYVCILYTQAFLVENSLIFLFTLHTMVWSYQWRWLISYFTTFTVYELLRTFVMLHCQIFSELYTNK